MIYYSARAREALKRQLAELPLGFAHYSYGIVCRRFLDAFALRDMNVTELVMPEIYPNWKFLPQGQNDTRPIHLMFKPFDEFRILKGAYNIAHVAWEYTRLPAFRRLPRFHPRRAHPLNDYTFALSLVEEVWVACAFSKEALTNEGVANVQIVPAPITLPAWDVGDRPSSTRAERSHDVMQHPLQIVGGHKMRFNEVQAQSYREVPGETLFMAISERKRGGGKVFLSMLNPNDPRKNLGTLLAGFQRYCQQSAGKDLLVIKIIVDGHVDTLENVVNSVLPRRLREASVSAGMINCDNIILFSGYMTATQMDRLYSVSDLYLCTSSAEGQNLPLLEAMARRVVPVTPATTAMADYIAESNAFVLRATEGPVSNEVAEAYGLVEADWYDVSVDEVTRGVAAASECDPDLLQQKRNNAERVVRERYSLQAVGQLIEDRLTKIGH